MPADRRTVALETRIVEMAGLAQCLPSPTDQRGGAAGRRRRQIARTRALARPRTVGQVVRVATGAAHGLVGTGCRRSPRRVAAVGGVEGERVLRVDALDRRPWQLDRAEHVHQADATVVHHDGRSPEDRPACAGHERERWADLPQRPQPVTDEQCDQRTGAGEADGDAQDASPHRSEHVLHDRIVAPIGGC